MRWLFYFIIIALCTRFGGYVGFIFSLCLTYWLRYEHHKKENFK